MSEINSAPTEWNLNSYKVNLIGNNIQGSMDQFKEGRYRQCFKEWKTIRITISSRLHPDDNIRCKIGERIIEKQTRLDSKGKQRITWRYKNYLENYIEYVQKLLKGTGLDLTEKSQSGLF